MAILKILFTLFLLSFSIAEVGRIQFPNGIAFTLNDLLLIILVGYFIGFKLINKSKFPKSYLKRPLLSFIGIAFVSLLINYFNYSLNNLLVSALYLVRFILYVSLYFIVLNFDSNFKRKIPLFLIASGFIAVIFGYVQYLFYPSLKNLFYLGWDEHLYRMFSTFLDPNFAGIFFSLFFIFSLILVEKNIKDKMKLSFYILVSLLSLLSVYLTYSRSGLIMLLVSIFVFLLLKNKKKLIIASFILLILIIFIAPKSFKTEGTNLLRINSSTARVESLEQAIEIYKKHPVFGVGFNAYRYAQNKYVGLNTTYWETTHSGAGTDNSFAFVLATTGIVGFISYIYLIYKIIILSRLKIKKNLYAPVLISILIGLMSSSLFINGLFYVFIIEWVWILIGLTESS
jgi:O-antigen ligase